MKALRIYGSIWLLVSAAVAVSYFAGLLNETTLVISGFVVSTLAAMGLLGLLPALIDDHFTPRTYPAGFRTAVRVSSGKNV